MFKLSEMNVGETGQIKKINGSGHIRKRLFDMGVTPNSMVFLRKKLLLVTRLKSQLEAMNLL